jgi:hypothetical protein
MSEIRDSRPGLFKAEDKPSFGVKPANQANVPNGQVNPWAKETRNVTQQMLLTKQNPELAKQLKAAAGV